jgi:hypothetical protein
MRKRLIAKGNIHKSDHLRALVTDTLPGDIPIIISNDGFYRNMRPTPIENAEQREFVTRVLTPARHYTLPYRYSIMRPSGSPRRLSLMHPSGQLDVVNLYRDYAELICYHCRKSDASIRSPRKVGSLFFVRGFSSGKNSVKHAGIDTVDLETTVSNPASYFAYDGVDRAFKFFTSTDYLRLEKRFAVMHFTDISKCFNSIYTHTLFWATSDKRTAKDNVQTATFSNSFDRLMQSVNYNETNGICIGAEVSRVFAELILSEVDRRIVLSLEQQNLRFRVHYEFRRYVDDFYVFSQNEKVADQVLAAIGACLSEFNLHLNESKTLKVPRPFITLKSRMIRDANNTLDEFFAKFIRTAKADGISYSYPLRIRRPQALLRSLLDSIKASCFDNRSGYADISNYVISALASRVTVLIDGYRQGPINVSVEDETNDDNYVSGIVLLLEAIYFFYNVDPTVASSLRVAQAAILSFHFFEKRMTHRAPFLAEQIVRWTFQFIKELSGASAHHANACIPLEAINVLLVLGEVGRGEVLARRAIADFCGEIDALFYFEIVSYLFCLKDDTEFDTLRDKLFERARVLLKGKDKLRIEAHAAYLALDLLSCPHISNTKRASLFNELRADMGLANLSKASAVAAVEAFEESPWFVDWRKANLLAMIKKKELSAVY